MKFSVRMIMSWRDEVSLAQTIEVASSAKANRSALGILKLLRRLLSRMFQSRGETALPCGQLLVRRLVIVDEP